MENWKKIPDFNYEAEEFSGKIRSLPRNTTKGKILKPSISNSGYYRVVLCKNGKTYSQSIHVLMAMTFKNYIPKSRKIHIDHIDNNKLNNSASNLRELSASENLLKRKALDFKTSKYPNVSLTYNGKKNQIWCASLNKKSYYFKSEIEAYQKILELKKIM